MIIMDLTDREIELLMAALGTHIGTLEKHPNARTPLLAELITELFELETDLREAVNRQDDGWNDPDDPDLLMDPVDFAAKHDKATSRAAERRAVNFRVRRANDDRSEAQKHDVFDHEWNPNDPKNW